MPRITILQSTIQYKHPPKDDLMLKTPSSINKTTIVLIDCFWALRKRFCVLVDVIQSFPLTKKESERRGTTRYFRHIVVITQLMKAWKATQ